MSQLSRNSGTFYSLEHLRERLENALKGWLPGEGEVYSITFTPKEREDLLSLVSETQPITDNDKRWRFLEHGCQWVSWTPINGQTVSFDPRNVTGYAGDLIDMRGQADIELRKQLNTLREGAEALAKNVKQKAPK